MAERLEGIAEAVVGLLRNPSLLGGMALLVILVTLRRVRQMYRAIALKGSFSIVIYKQPDGWLTFAVKGGGLRLLVLVNIYSRKK